MTKMKAKMKNTKVPPPHHLWGNTLHKSKRKTLMMKLLSIREIVALYLMSLLLLPIAFS
jgi:hypothetical protein